ncbi:hypothetical protein L0337_29085 [candidate division KSB1 bacterium]|nr:hypothetical protein [candidate division KSB1 bacterium]
MKKSSKRSSPRPYPTAEQKNEALPNIAEPAAAHAVTTPISHRKPQRVEEKRIAGYAVSDEVWQFAAANDLIPHLETAVRLVYECFPTVSDIQLLHEIDWDVENRSYIVIEIKITGSIASILEQYDRFTLQKIRQVPPEKRDKIILSL